MIASNKKTTSFSISDILGDRQPDKKSYRCTDKRDYRGTDMRDYEYTERRGYEYTDRRDIEIALNNYVRSRQDADKEGYEVLSRGMNRSDRHDNMKYPSPFFPTSTYPSLTPWLVNSLQCKQESTSSGKDKTKTLFIH